mmetsp:Transcript_25647/g.55755  ORF Transcript_25647/g.55755 Transcript_25647/m.55755 type:complete len:203 (-) Transcript_25647:1125-1733(-)
MCRALQSSHPRAPQRLSIGRLPGPLPLRTPVHPQRRCRCRGAAADAGCSGPTFGRAAWAIAAGSGRKCFPIPTSNGGWPATNAALGTGHPDGSIQERILRGGPRASGPASGDRGDSRCDDLHRRHLQPSLTVSWLPRSLSVTHWEVFLEGLRGALARRRLGASATGLHQKRCCGRVLGRERRTSTLRRSRTSRGARLAMLTR